MNFGCGLKNIFFKNSKPYDGPVEGGLVYNTNEGLIIPMMEDNDILFHPGMTLHILTGGRIQAACHGVTLPNIEGLSRVSQAFFFCPQTSTVLQDPLKNAKVLDVEGDKELIPRELSFENNWKEGMEYVAWNEELASNYQKVFSSKY